MVGKPVNDPFSLDGRLQTLERQVNYLKNQVNILQASANDQPKGSTVEARGYALWCKPGSHPFGDDDMERKPITTLDDDGNEVTYWMCGLHRPDYMTVRKPKRSLKQIMQEINEAEIDE
jgi:hypothetical protein